MSIEILLIYSNNSPIDVASFILFIASEDSIKYFDRDYIVKAPTLYHIKSKGETMKNLSEKSYQLLNKKMKIESSKEKNSSKTYKINAELDNIKSLIEKKDYATSCFSFLNFAVAEIEELSTKIADSKTNLNEDDIYNAFKNKEKILIKK